MAIMKMNKTLYFAYLLDKNRLTSGNNIRVQVVEKTAITADIDIHEYLNFVKLNSSLLMLCIIFASLCFIKYFGLFNALIAGRC